MVHPRTDMAAGTRQTRTQERTRYKTAFMFSATTTFGLRREGGFEGQVSGVRVVRYISVKDSSTDTGDGTGEIVSLNDYMYTLAIHLQM